MENGVFGSYSPPGGAIQEQDQETLRNLNQIQLVDSKKKETKQALVMQTQPVKVELRPGVKLPWKNQYSLKEEAVRGIEPQIEGLLKAGVLKITQNPQSNTPLLPVRKLDDSYRL
ncbi:hypothetical protein NFI96_022677, partial [Prochilodus magdalenae]